MPRQKNYDDEKFSYIVVKKGSIIEKKDDAETPAEKSFFWGRIIRKNMRRGGHVVMDLCTRRGAIERVVPAKSHTDDDNYKHAKKLKWGDLWPYVDRIPNRYRKESLFGERLW